ncbi:hypothetical protein CH299_18585 [Rhodococcus sp. 14-2686-1-2]|nr:hypothetical protein CH301_17890 [Rhodococcus sp. 15-1189-1-1a]OZF12130.1 hypothetical protein CH299_18585 [Rhodococcus sp. 14-2686-1-2]
MHVHVEADNRWIVAATGEEVDEDDIHPDTEGDAEGDIGADEGMLHANTVQHIRTWRFEYFTTNDHRIEAGLEPAPELAALVAGDTDDA